MDESAFKHIAKSMLDEIPEEKIMDNKKTLAAVNKVLLLKADKGELTAAYEHCKSVGLEDEEEVFWAGYAYAIKSIDDLINTFEEMGY